MVPGSSPAMKAKKNLEAAEAALSCDGFMKPFPAGDARHAVDIASGA